MSVLKKKQISFFDRKQAKPGFTNYQSQPSGLWAEVEYKEKEQKQANKQYDIFFGEIFKFLRFLNF